MKCECGYEGVAEFGSFKDERKPILPIAVHLRCPKCKSNRQIDYMEAYDDAIETILYPDICHGHEGRKHPPIEYRAHFLRGSETSSWGFGVHCERCSWGHGGGFSKRYFDIVEKYIGKDELRRYLEGARLTKQEYPKEIEVN